MRESNRPIIPAGGSESASGESVSRPRWWPRFYTSHIGSRRKPIDLRSEISSGVRKARTLVLKVSAKTKISTGFDVSEMSGKSFNILPVEMEAKSASSFRRIVTVSFPGAKPCGTVARNPVQTPSSWNEMIKRPLRSIVLSRVSILNESKHIIP